MLDLSQPYLRLFDVTLITTLLFGKITTERSFDDYHNNVIKPIYIKTNLEYFNSDY